MYVGLQEIWNFVYAKLAHGNSNNKKYIKTEEEGKTRRVNIPARGTSSRKKIVPTAKLQLGPTVHEGSLVPEEVDELHNERLTATNSGDIHS